MEPFLHAFTILWSIGGGVFLWVSKNYNFDGFQCIIYPGPETCEDVLDVECGRGRNALKYRMLFLALPTGIAFIIIFFSMFKLGSSFVDQRKQLQQSVARSPSGIPSDNVATLDESAFIDPGQSISTRVIKQAIFYTLAFFITYISSPIHTALYMRGKSVFPLRIMTAILLPLQGFFNSLVYIRPRAISYRNLHPETSVCEATFRIIRMSSSIISSRDENISTSVRALNKESDNRV